MTNNREHKTKVYFLRKSALYFILTALLMPSTWAYAEKTADPDIFAVPKTYAVQNRKFKLANQLTGLLGYMPMDSFTKGVVLGGSYTKYFSDFTAWEMVNANYVIDIDTGLKSDLINEYGVTPGDIPDFPEWYVTTGIIYTPIYSKNLLFNKDVVWGDISFVAGAGAGSFKLDGVKPLVQGGAVLRFFWTEKSSIKIDIRENLPFLSGGVEPFLMVGLAYTYQLGSAPSKKQGEADELEELFK